MNDINVLDHGYVNFIESWGSDARVVESARMSTDGAFRGWDKDAKFLEFLYMNKHLTPFEMCGLTIEIKAPIMVFREWHRHRTQSYNEMSARYIPMPNDHYFPSIQNVVDRANAVTNNKQAQRINDGEIPLTHDHASSWLNKLDDLYCASQDVYEEGLKLGIPKELARLSVTVGRYSKMRASGNLRNWLAFLTLRMDVHAQYEIRLYANAVSEMIKDKFPRTYALFMEYFDGQI